VLSNQGGAGVSFSGRIYAVGSNAGSPGQVTVYAADTGKVLFTFDPYGPSFTGGVRVAVGDVNGTGVQDIITAPGPGMSPQVKVFDSQTHSQIVSFMAYDWRFGGGVFVAAGDLQGNGKDEIITGADASGGPHVKAFDGAGHTLLSFYAYNPRFTGGVRVAAGDVRGIVHADIITGPGAGTGPHVEVFDGKNAALVQSFYA
jgi:hypothetical protein